MKKYFLGIVALLTVVSASAFVNLTNAGGNARQDDLLWYRRNANGTYTFINTGETPSVSCPSGSDVICAKGFEDSQDASQIDDNTMAADQLLRASFWEEGGSLFPHFFYIPFLPLILRHTGIKADHLIRYRIGISRVSRQQPVFLPVYLSP